VIELTLEQMERAERVLAKVPGAAPRAMANAINRAAETARTEAARKVRETYYVRHQDVIQTIKIYKATPSDLHAIVISRGHLFPLTKFRVTPRQPQPRRKRPIVVRVKRGAGGTVEKAFVARMPSGHLGVFHRAGKPRLPIIERFGPSVPQMLESEDVRRWVEEKAAERLDDRLEHEIRRFLKD